MHHDRHSEGVRAGENSDGTQPAMMSFKTFLGTQDDTISDEEAIKKYAEYKLEFKRQQLNEFFVNHKDEECNRNEEVVAEKCFAQDDQAFKDSSSKLISSSNASKMRSYKSLALSSSLISNQIYNDLVLVILLLRNTFKIS